MFIATDKQQTILIADDEASLRKVLSAMLRKEGYHVLTASDGLEARDLLNTNTVDVLLTDLRMPKLDGMSLLKDTLEKHPQTPVVLLTAHGTVDTAVSAMKLGAFDYLTKPFDQDELRFVLKKATATAKMQSHEPETATSGRFGIIGTSRALDPVFKTIEKVAASPSTVLVTGESGTGKELIAAALHHHSTRAKKPFIKINCAAIPRDLIESELFGYERGAFTGAVNSKPGRFELADEGTLFLDEIGTIPQEMQVKLLRALQESEFERVGGIETKRVDVRLIAATNIDLQSEVQAGRFREDLFYRLNVVPLVLPALRERREDIPLLVEHFIAKYNQRLGKHVQGIEDAALQQLQLYSWPGNIRELENVVERAVLMSEHSQIRCEDLPSQFTTIKELEIEKDNGGPSKSTPPTGTVGPLKEIVRQHTVSLERELIARALEETRGNVTQAARMLHISRKSLQNKMKELGLREHETAEINDTTNGRNPIVGS